MIDLGMLLGGIATFTALASLLVSIKNYTRISEMKSLDLRIKFQESLNDLDLARKGIEDFLEGANNSRIAVMAATGQLTGDAGQIWRKQVDEDKEALQRLLARAPKNVGGYEKFSPSELVSQLIVAHRFIGELEKVREKYQKCLDEDDKWRHTRQAQIGRGPTIGPN